MKKAIGYLILLTIFILLFYQFTLDYGWKITLIAFGVSFLVVLLVLLAVNLIVNNK